MIVLARKAGTVDTKGAAVAGVGEGYYLRRNLLPSTFYFPREEIELFT